MAVSEIWMSGMWSAFNVMADTTTSRQCGRVSRVATDHAP